MVLDDGIALPLKMLTFTKPVTETDPELRGKNAKSVLHVLCSQHTSAFVQEAREPYYFSKHVFFFLSFKWMAVMTKPVRVAAVPQTT